MNLVRIMFLPCGHSDYCKGCYEQMALGCPSASKECSSCKTQSTVLVLTVSENHNFCPLSREAGATQEASKDLQTLSHFNRLSSD